MYGRSREKEESIYNLIPKTPEKPPKTERLGKVNLSFILINYCYIHYTTVALDIGY